MEIMLEYNTVSKSARLALSVFPLPSNWATNIAPAIKTPTSTDIRKKIIRNEKLTAARASEDNLQNKKYR